MIKREVDISEAKELGYAKDEPNQKTIVLYEYELEDIPKLLNGELTHVNGTQWNYDTGKDEWFRFTPEALEVWNNSKEADELKYLAKIEEKLNAAKHSFQNILSKSIAPAELIADRIRTGEWRLNPHKDKNAPRELGLDPNSHLELAFSRLKHGKIKYRTNVLDYEQIQANVEVKFLQWLKELQSPPQEQPKGDTDTSTTPQESKGGTEAQNEPELTGVRETVVNILDPFQNGFVGTGAFDKAVNRVCAYFEGETLTATKPINVRKGQWKKVGKALGDIHRDIYNLKAIDYGYLKFAKETFDCFARHDISNPKLAQVTLYKYMIQ